MNCCLTSVLLVADFPLPLWAVYVIAIMGAIILILVVMFVLVLCTKLRLW